MIAGTFVLAFASSAFAETEKNCTHFVIEAGPLTTALRVLSEQANVPILARSDQIAGLSTKAFAADDSIEFVLRKLLEPHGLSISKVGEGFAVIEAPITRAPPPTPPPRLRKPLPVVTDEPLWDKELRASPVIVTGYRSSHKAAARQKREATQILDGVSQDTITLLPDLTTSDIARRIPGLSSIPKNGTDTTRQIEGHQNVLIRGIDANYIQATIDDLPFASASAGNRAADLSLFPPTSIRRVDAIKTLNAADDPHGLSGRLNLQTQSAFDYSIPSWVLRASVGENSTAGNLLDDQGANLRVDTFATNRIGEQGSLGVSLAASYERFFSTSADRRPGAEDGSYLFYSSEPDNHQPVDDFHASTGFASPARSQRFLFESAQQRASALLKLEYKPNAETSMSLTGGIFREHEKETRHEHLVSVDADMPPIDQSDTSGIWTSGSIESGFVSQPARTTSAMLLGHLKHHFDDRSALAISGSISSAEVTEARNMSKFIRGMTPDGIVRLDSFAYTLGPGGTTLEFFDDEGANDPSTYASSYIREIEETTEQDLFHLRGSFEKPLGSNSNWTLEFGGALTFREQDFDLNYVEGDVFDVSACDKSDIRDCPLATFLRFVEDKRFGTSDPNVDFLLVNDSAVRGVWRDQGMPRTTDRTDSSLSSDYWLDERVSGAFSRLIYDDDRWRIEFGLRFDNTQSSVGYYLRDSRLPAEPDAAQYQPVTRNQSYQNLLPTLISRFELTDNIILRGGFSQTLGRPNIRDLTQGDSIGAPESGYVTIKRGNPDLRPLISNNFDASFEYYLGDRAGLLSAALFYKDVQDLIFTRRTIIENYALDEDMLTAEIIQPVNANQANLYGLELAANVQFEDLLPAPFSNFSFTSNVTWTESDFVYVNTDGATRDPGGWINQPNLIANAQLAYETERFGANIAYNYVGEYLSNILSEDGDLYDTYALSRSVTDLQIRLNVTENLTLIGEVENLTAEGLGFNRRFPTGDLIATRAQRGRVAWIGARLKFF